MKQMRIFAIGLTALLVGALSGLPSSDWSIGVWTTSASAGEKGTKSMSTLQKISPQGKKQLLRAAPGDSTTALVELVPGASPESLADELERLGAEQISWSVETRLLTVQIEAAKLDELAALTAVTYVQVGGRFSR